MNAQIEQLTSQTATLETQHSEKAEEHEHSLNTKIEQLMQNILDLQEMVESKDD